MRHGVGTADEGRHQHPRRDGLRTRLGLVAAGLAMVVMAGCAGATGGPGSGELAGTGASGGGSGKEKQLGGTLTVGVNQDVDSMDPNRTSGVVNQLMWFSIMDQLLYEDSEKKLVPGLAESWSISSDGTEYTFKLRKDVKFQDGTPFNAEAVKFMFDRIAEKDNVRALAFSYMGADQYTGTEVVDEYTAKLKMKVANHTLLTRLTRGYFAVPSPKAVREMGNSAFAKKPVGTGPFIFKEWVPQSHMTAERWPDYNWPAPVWGEKGPAYLDKIVFRIIPENAARRAALETNEIQVAQNLAEQDLAQVKADPNIKLLQAVQQGMAALLYLNTEKAPTNELAVRQAINHALNKPALIKAVCFDIPKPAKSILTSSTFGYDPEVPEYTYNPDKAKQLLEAAGWKPGPEGIRVKDGQRLTLVVPSVTAQTGCPTSLTAAMGELIQAQLKDVGIEMKIELLSGPAATEFEIQGRHNMTLGGFINEDPDVVRTQLHSVYIGRKSQPVRFRNAEFDKVLEQQYSVPRGPERAGYLKQMQRMVYENALVAPVYEPVATWAMRKNVEGIWIGSANYYAYFRYAYYTK